jgi:hypothetical protein
MSIVTWPNESTPHRDRLRAIGQQPIRLVHWIAEANDFALNHGWHPKKAVTSGFRPGRDSHTSSGVSNHQAEDWNNGETPCGAEDFGGYDDQEGFETKMELIAILHQNHYTRGDHPDRHMLVAPIGFHDDGHCSGNGH